MDSPYAPAPTAPEGTPEYFKQLAAYQTYQASLKGGDVDGEQGDSGGAGGEAEGEVYTYTATYQKRGQRRKLTFRLQGVHAHSKAEALAGPSPLAARRSLNPAERSPLKPPKRARSSRLSVMASLPGTPCRKRIAMSSASESAWTP